MKLEKILAYSLLLLFFSISSAFAVSLEEAKSAGQIGEKRDGYIGLVQPDAPADVVALVSDVNRQRKERYEAMARENSISVADVARLAYVKAVENTRSGHYVEDTNGRWVRKP